MEVLSTVFESVIKEVAALSQTSTVVTEHNVYQIGDTKRLPLIDKIVEALILPGSGITGIAHLADMLAKAQAGKSCLLLLEHYSNLDLPLFSYLLRQAAGAEGVAEALVAIAGIKLNEASPTVAAFTGAYTRIVIYPSRSSHAEPGEVAKSNAINRAAMKALLEVKTQGKLILVFPSGTRYRPWEPSTKRGVREIDSYIKSFDYMCCVAINGEVLHIAAESMIDDYISQDVVRFTAGPVQVCKEFRDEVWARAEAAGIADKKQAVADAIMERLEVMHIAAEKERLQG